MIPDGPLLWYVNRSTGLVLLALLTLTLVIGVLSTRGEAGTRLPRFVVQALHRNLGLLSMTLLVVHIASAVLDEYVDIRWWQSFVPWQLSYRPLWLALGVVSFDVLVAVVLSSLVRDRLPHRLWLAVHLAVYPTWAVAVAHGLGIGTDTGAGWARWFYIGSAALVAGAVALRLLVRAQRARTAPAALVAAGGAR